MVFTNSRVNTAGRNTTDKPAAHSVTGIMNVFIVSNIRIQTRPSPNTYVILDTNLAPCKISWIFYILSKKKEYILIPWKIFYIYSETKRNNQINEEFKTGSNTICDVIQHENDRCRL